MLAQQQLRQSWTRGATICLLATMLAFAVPGRVAAQENGQSSPVTDIFKRVVLDPTTYAPAAIAYYATMRDWDTSQPFFAHGANEMNARFTVSGLSNDRPIGYDAGRRLILRDALVNLQISAISNTADQVVERLLIDRYPNHRKLVRTLGWVERISLASFLSYQLSAQHFQQTALNERMAVQFGF